MIDHSKNLETVSEATKKLGEEINQLQGILAQKRELYLKYLGIAEYLSATENETDVNISELTDDDKSSDEESSEPVS
tara:strand:+ start:65 stop:295 length:231 start_codon:yes stop_codon:yes gene_type:complete